MLDDIDQYGPTPESTDPQVTLMLRQLDQARVEWRRELGDITDDDLRWQSFERGHSIGAILTHIAEVEIYWLHHIASGRPYRDLEAELLDGASIDQDAVSWAVPPLRSLAAYDEILESIRAETRALVAALPPNFVAMHPRRPDETFTLRWLLTHTILHEAYHGGQAVLLGLELDARRKAAAQSI